MDTCELNAGSNSAIDFHPIQGVEILLVMTCYRNRDKLRPFGPLGLFTILLHSTDKALDSFSGRLFSLIFILRAQHELRQKNCKSDNNLHQTRIC